MFNRSLEVVDLEMKIQTMSDDGFPEVALTLNMEHFPPGTTTTEYHLIFCKIK